MNIFKQYAPTLHTTKTISPLEQLARHGDYASQLKHNLAIAHTISFETSPYRLLPHHAFKKALLATRRLVTSLFTLRKTASQNWQHDTIDKLQYYLSTSRHLAMLKSNQISIAQDVFVLLSFFLGLPAMPDPHTTHSDNSHDSRARLAMRSVAEVCRIPSSKPNVRRRQTSKKMKTSVSAVTKRHNLPSEHAFVKQRSCSSVPYFPPVFLDEDDDSFPA